MVLAFMGLTSSRDVTVWRTLSTRIDLRPIIFGDQDLRYARDQAFGQNSARAPSICWHCS